MAVKVFEKELLDEITEFSNTFFSPILRGFRKVLHIHSSIYIKSVKNILRHLRGLLVLCQLRELLKTYGTIRYGWVSDEPVIAKLVVSGLSEGILTFIQTIYQKENKLLKINFVVPWRYAFDFIQHFMNDFFFSLRNQMFQKNGK